MSGADGSGYPAIVHAAAGRNVGGAEPLIVRFMGAFSMTYRCKPFDILHSDVTKSAQLLIALLYHHDAGLTRGALRDMLYGDGEADAGNCLKALLFRLRQKLQTSALPGESHILFADGVYRFTPDIPVARDVDEFLAALKAVETTSGAARTTALARACAAYHGELVPLLCGERWIAAENGRLVQLYEQAVRELATRYAESGAFGAAYTLFKRAALLFPYEEAWHCGGIRSLLFMGRRALADEELKAVSSMLTRQLGMPLSEQMCALADEVKRREPHIPSAKGIRKALDADAVSDEGAMECGYASFVDSYRILRRIMEHDGVRGGLLICTALDCNDEPLQQKERLNQAVQQLRGVLSQVLQRSDLFARCGAAQMLVLIWDASKPSMHERIRRIREAFAAAQSNDGSDCRLDCSLLWEEPFIGGRGGRAQAERPQGGAAAKERASDGAKPQAF